MAPNWSKYVKAMLVDEDEILTIVLAYQIRSKKWKRKHRWWVLDLLKKRNELGAYNTLVKELQFDNV